MSLQNFKTNSYCVGQKHYSGTKKINGKITFNKKTGKELKLIVGQRVICKRKKSMNISDNTLQAEGLSVLFKNICKSSVKVGKKLAKAVLKIPGRALEIGANVGSAFASRSPKAASLSLPEVINIYHTGKGVYLGKFV